MIKFYYLDKYYEEIIQRIKAGNSMENKLSVWQIIELINKDLEDKMLCVPICYAINGIYVRELKESREKNHSYEGTIFPHIASPSQRAYQMEYRYKKMNIFKPYINVLEYATYDFLSGNLVCAYLSLIPIIESILYEWSKEKSGFVFEKVYASIPNFITYLEKQMNEKTGQNNNLKHCIEFEINYVNTTLTYFFENFDKYESHNLSDTFNRNLSLHKLKGVSNSKEIIYNIYRLFLLLDTIADLYTLTDLDKYFMISFYADPTKDKEYAIRERLYELLYKNRFIGNELDILRYGIIESTNETEKELYREKIEKRIEIAESIFELIEKKNK